MKAKNHNRIRVYGKEENDRVGVMEGWGVWTGGLFARVCEQAGPVIGVEKKKSWLQLHSSPPPGIFLPLPWSSWFITSKDGVVKADYRRREDRKITFISRKLLQKCQNEFESVIPTDKLHPSLKTFHFYSLFKQQCNKHQWVINLTFTYSHELPHGLSAYCLLWLFTHVDNKVSYFIYLL